MLWAASQLSEAYDISLFDLAALLYVAVGMCSLLPVARTHLQPVGNICVNLGDECQSVIEDIDSLLRSKTCLYAISRRFSAAYVTL
jgi:hypothetical protein